MLRRLPVTPDDGPPVEIPLDPAVLDELVAAEPRPTPSGRPWVTVNMVASADGATQVGGVSGPLGSDADLAVFVALRAACDVILAGSATVTAERYRPPMGNDARRARRIARGQAPLPRIAVVSNRGDVDLSLPLFADARPDNRPILLVAGRVSPSRRAELDAVAEVLVVGDERVDLGTALGALHEDLGAGLVLAEGGATLNGLLLDADLVDEWCLTLAPMVVGGDAVRAAHSPGGGREHPMRLVRLYESDGELMLRYVRDRTI
jgi:riboflavin biosynthesis pyrimidine reductase